MRFNRFSRVSGARNRPDRLGAASDVESRDAERLEDTAKPDQSAVAPRREPGAGPQALALNPLTLPLGEPQPPGDRRPARHRQTERLVVGHPQHVASRAPMPGDLDGVCAASDGHGRRHGLAGRRKRQPQL